MKRIERCVECDEPTGKAGRLDDSLYDEGEGPFCEDCFHKRQSNEEKHVDSMEGFGCPRCGGPHMADMPCP